MKYVGKLYRPWMEANSVLVQVTIGCSHNDCSFCDMYRDKPKFRIKRVEEVYRDLEEIRKAYPYVKDFFLIDGN